MLYSDMADSAPMLARPVYVSRTNEAGVFNLTSLAAGKYRLIALKDGNNDYMYNLPSELVGFSDSLVEPYYAEPAVEDTSVKTVVLTSDQFAMNLFPEPDSLQRVLKGSMVATHKMLIAFRYPTRNLTLTPMNIDSNQVWSVREFSSKTRFPQLLAPGFIARFTPVQGQ